MIVRYTPLCFGPTATADEAAIPTVSKRCSLLNPQDVWSGVGGCSTARGSCSCTESNLFGDHTPTLSPPMGLGQHTVSRSGNIISLYYIYPNLFTITHDHSDFCSWTFCFCFRQFSLLLFTIGVPNHDLLRSCAGATAQPLGGRGNRGSCTGSEKWYNFFTKNKVIAANQVRVCSSSFASPPCSVYQIWYCPGGCSNEHVRAFALATVTEVGQLFPQK